MKARIPNQSQASRKDMLRQVQQMQEDMANLENEIKEREFTASSGGGAVEVSVKGSHEIVSINIKPEVVDPDDVEMLQDLLIASLNEAMRKADETMEGAMSSYTGGLGIPGLSGLGL